MKKHNFSRKEIESIAAAVEVAESETSGEIATAFIKESDDYAKAELFFSIVISFVYFITSLFFAEQIEHFLMQKMWTYNNMYLIYFYGFSTFLVMVISYFICNIPFVDRLIVSKKTMAKKVHQRALQYFTESNVSATRDRTGILIFISFMEQRVELLADVGISEKIPHEKWQEIVNLIISGIKEKKLVYRLNDAIMECGRLLKIHFPIKEDDTNELKNGIDILES